MGNKVGLCAKEGEMLFIFQRVFRKFCCRKIRRQQKEEVST